MLIVKGSWKRGELTESWPVVFKSDWPVRALWTLHSSLYFSTSTNGLESFPKPALPLQLNYPNGRIGRVLGARASEQVGSGSIVLNFTHFADNVTRSIKYITPFIDLHLWMSFGPHTRTWITPNIVLLSVKPIKSHYSGSFEFMFPTHRPRIVRVARICFLNYSSHGNWIIQPRLVKFSGLGISRNDANCKYPSALRLTTGKLICSSDTSRRHRSGKKQLAQKYSHVTRETLSHYHARMKPGCSTKQNSCVYVCVKNGPANWWPVRLDWLVFWYFVIHAGVVRTGQSSACSNEWRVFVQTSPSPLVTKGVYNFISKTKSNENGFF